MSQTTVTRALAAHSDGVPLIGTTRSFKAPVVEKKTSDLTDGRFVNGKYVSGFVVGDWSFVQAGMTPQLANQFGLTAGDIYSLTLKESVEDASGNEVQYKHEISGEIVKSSKDESKTGEEDLWTVEGITNTYKLTVDGNLVTDINTQTQKMIVNGKDLMSKHMSNVR